MTVDELIARARSGMTPAVLYWIGTGTVVTSPADLRGPGEEIDVRARFAELDDERRARYHALLVEAGVVLPPGPLRAPACDCASYVRWALRLPDRFPQRTPGRIPWMNTDAIWRDADGQQDHFTLDETGDPNQTRRGALLVYPKPPPGWRNPRGEAEDYGHIGIVTAIEGGAARGRPLAVLHCAPENWLAPPPPGGERNGIAETPPTRFDEHAAIAGAQTRAVWCTAVQG